MKSFNRLKCLNKTVCDFIELMQIKNAIVADVATDHGYLAELLSRNENISQVIATDISEKCLEKTKELISRCKLDKIKPLLGDGLEPIDRVDVVVLAGIGGYEIIKILSNQNITKTNKKKCTKFVLQPSKNEVDLRLFLMDKNYEIISDTIVKSGNKFYPIIVVDMDKDCTAEKTIFNLYFGRTNNIENQDFISFLNEIIDEYRFLEKMDKNYIESNEDLKLKFEIVSLANSLIKNRGD